MHSPMFTLEVFPPKRNAPVGTIYDTLDGLEGLNPDFISVTYGHGTHSDRTATARIAHTISKEYGIPAVAHLTALYSDKAKIDEALDMFEEAGVSAVLALRGDYIDGEQLVGEFNHASDLVSYIRSVKPDFKVFGACYPEGHYQADSLDQDIENLKIKVDAGVTHLISQLFYAMRTSTASSTRRAPPASPCRSRRASCRCVAPSPCVAWPSATPRASRTGSTPC